MRFRLEVVQQHCRHEGFQSLLGRKDDVSIDIPLGGGSGSCTARCVDMYVYIKIKTH